MTLRLAIKTKCRHHYFYTNVSNVRESKYELRWINTYGEKRVMSLCFIKDYKLN